MPVVGAGPRNPSTLLETVIFIVFFMSRCWRRSSPRDRQPPRSTTGCLHLSVAASCSSCSFKLLHHQLTLLMMKHPTAFAQADAASAALSQRTQIEPIIRHSDTVPRCMPLQPYSTNTITSTVSSSRNYHQHPSWSVSSASPSQQMSSSSTPVILGITESAGAKLHHPCTINCRTCWRTPGRLQGRLETACGREGTLGFRDEVAGGRTSRCAAAERQWTRCRKGPAARASGRPGWRRWGRRRAPQPPCSTPVSAPQQPCACMHALQMRGRVRCLTLSWHNRRVCWAVFERRRIDS